MKIFRNNNFWLRHRVTKHIETNHKDLFDPFFLKIKIRVAEYFSDQKNWFSVFLIVVTFFSISSFINLDFLNFLDFDAVVAKAIIDQRTTNLAAIISISLVVVGFLITNLALKSQITIQLLFKHSFLYSILYLTFSTISCFIILSNLRNTLDDFVFSRAVLAGTYLCILILFLIGKLFRNIIHFTDEKKISSMLEKELLIEAREKIKIGLMNKYSFALYQKIASKNCNEYKLDFSINDFLKNDYSLSKSTSDYEEKSYRKLKDVNLFFLKVFIFFKKINKKNIITFKNLTLNENVNYAEDFLWSGSAENSKFEKWLLRRCLVVGKELDPKKNKDENLFRNEFDQKILQLAEENKYRNLEDPLAAYLELYKLQMINQR